VKESSYNIWVERGDAAYVFNGVSGALLRVPRDHRRTLAGALAGDDESGCPPELLLKLATGRMLVQDGCDEVDVLRKRYEQSRRDASHLALTLVTSLGCNFDCPYCFEAKHPSIMDAPVQEAVLELLDDQLPRIRSFHVSWFGGEPLVGKAPLLALSAAFGERCDRGGVRYDADITTNGYLLDEGTCAQLRDRRVTRAQVSLDGPPETHDRMRPLAGGRASFWAIVENLRHAVEYLSITIRMNVDALNFSRADELLQILADHGLAGKVAVYAGQITGNTDDPRSPSATYGPRCFTNPEFARAELEFQRLVARYGFGSPSLPRPTGTPCTAVRANELVVGSAGELYKCWESVGNRQEVIGHIRDYKNPNGRLAKWLRYDPFSNDECQGCIALPVCMGGCAAHAMDILQYENRCGTFRHTYREQVLAFVESAERAGAAGSAPGIGLARRMESR
jgi:uncharacterized protein